MTVFLPTAGQALVGAGGLADPHWYRWAQAVTQAVNASSATPAEEPTPEPAPLVLNGAGSVRAIGSVESGQVTFSLVGDSNFPSATRYYGTGDDGKRGWHLVADAFDAGTGITLDTDADTGVTTINWAASLDDLSDVDAAAPSDGDVLIYDAATESWKPGAQTGGGGGAGPWEFVEEIEIASATDTITFSSLNLSSDLGYMIEIRSFPSSTGDQSVFLNFNGDTSNYERQVAQFDGSSTNFARTSSRYAFWGFNSSVSGATNYSMYASLRLSQLSGKYPVSRIEASSVSSGGVATELNTHVWKNTSNVTSITLSKASNFAVGTACRLYKSVGEPEPLAASSIETAPITGVTADNNVQAVLENLASRIAALE